MVVCTDLGVLFIEKSRESEIMIIIIIFLKCEDFNSYIHRKSKSWSQSYCHYWKKGTLTNDY